MSKIESNLEESDGEPIREVEEARCDSDKRSLEFTSEIYKLEISNFPRNLNKFHMAKNLIEQYYKINNYKKIKLAKTRIYVTFGSTEDRDDAIKKINNSDYKGWVMHASLANPKDDPYIKRQKLDQSNAKVANDIDAEASGAADELIDINKQVCPLSDRDYEIQIKIKTRDMKHILTMYKNIKKLSPNLQRDAPRLNDWNETNKFISCPFDGVEPSPQTTGYRNKCEFNVDRDGNCGFRMGRYKDGSAKVAHPPSDCPIVNSKMFQIIDSFESYIKNGQDCKLSGFDPVTHTGNVRQLTIRTNERRECLIIIDLASGELNQIELEQELMKVVDILSSIEGVISIYSNISEKAHLTGMDQSLKLIHGVPYLMEYMTIQPGRELRFRIGPQSFFQINTKAAEILYRSIGEIAGLNKKSIVLDVGSGIGTISLSLAEKVFHVYGIEIIESAVQDAKFNAKENDIKNVEFFAGKAEELMGVTLDVAKRLMYDELNNEGDIVAVVDPPRAGFNNSFVKTLRASNIKKLVYVACDPKSNENLLSLCRPKSKAYQGEPFVPTRAKAIDLFPQTKACELILLYERLDQIIPSVA